MIRMLGPVGLLGSLNRMQLSKYHKMVSNLRYYLPSNSSPPLLSTTTTARLHDMSKQVKPLSRKALKRQTSDGIPLSYDLIYVSHEYHTIAQYLCMTTTSVFTVAGSIQAFVNSDVIFPNLLTSALHIWIAIAFYCINIGTLIVAYKSPVRIYHDKETGIYKAIFNGLNPKNPRTLEFAKGGVEQILPLDDLTFFRFNKFKIKGQSLYMFDTFFRYPGDFYNMFDEIQKEE